MTLTPEQIAPFVPPPHWPCKAPSETRHPLTADQWDYRNDPTGQRNDLAYRRLCFAGDFADPRLESGELAIVHRLDLSIVTGQYIFQKARSGVLKVARDRQEAELNEAAESFCKLKELLSDIAKIADDYNAALDRRENGTTASYQVVDKLLALAPKIKEAASNVAT